MRTSLISPDVPVGAWLAPPDRERSSRRAAARKPAVVRRSALAESARLARRPGWRGVSRTRILFAAGLLAALAVGVRSLQPVIGRAAAREFGQPLLATAAQPNAASAPASSGPGRWQTVWATAYCARCPVCETTFTTYTGAHAHPGGLAVARVGQRVAPLGSKVYLPRQGWVKVDDVGGGVASNQIDIRMATHAEAVQFGRRRIRIGLPATP